MRGQETRARGALAVLGLAALSGCQRAPSFNLLGSYFPAWLLCIAIGIVLAVLTHLWFRRIGLEAELWPAVVIYPSLACFFAFTLWLLLFG